MVETIFPFKSTTEALRYLNFSNPVRARSSEYKELVMTSPSIYTDHANQWAAVYLAVRAALKYQRARDRRMFRAYYLVEERDKGADITDLTSRYRLSRRRVFQILRNVLDDVTNELIRFELIPNDGTPS